MDAKEIADAIPDGGDPAGYLIPEPGCQLLDTLSQTFDNVAANFHDLVH